MHTRPPRSRFDLAFSPTPRPRAARYEAGSPAVARARDSRSRPGTGSTTFRVPRRTLAAALLFLGGFVGCDEQPLQTEVEVPTPSEQTIENPYRSISAVQAEGYEFAIRGVRRAIDEGADGNQLFRIAEGRVNRFMRMRGFARPGVPPIRIEAGAAVGAGSPAVPGPGALPDYHRVLDEEALSVGQRRHLKEVFDKLELLDGGISPEAFDSLLAKIERNAVRQLGRADARVILLATATASTFYREFHDDSVEEIIGAAAAAGLHPQALALLNEGEGDDGGWSWAGFIGTTVGSTVAAATAGGITGALTTGGPGAVPGAMIGAIGGAIGGAVGYTTTWLVIQLI